MTTTETEFATLAYIETLARLSLAPIREDEFWENSRRDENPAISSP